MSATPSILKILRYPPTRDRSLKSWSAADELLIQHATDSGLLCDRTVLVNDRFGFLTCQLHRHQPQVWVDFSSQEKSIRENLERNGLDVDQVSFFNPTDVRLEPTDLVLMKVPKSVDLFESQLHALAARLPENAIVLAGFMTRHFTKRWLDVAARYFESTEQTKAHKKARLLMLKNRIVPTGSLPNRIVKDRRGNEYKQRYGVFSAEHIDIGTELLLQHLKPNGDEKAVLDLACGNGVIAHQLRQDLPEAEIHLTDDFWLAIDSAKQNLSAENTHFHCADTLSDFADESFDLIATNPPFHFEYETSTEIALSMFADAKRCLKKGGTLWVVANRHLGYMEELRYLFGRAEVVSNDPKFVVLRAQR